MKASLTLSLMAGVCAGLQKRFGKVGFIKPVGQQHIAVQDESGRTIRVDKDCQVMKEYFDLAHVTYGAMSPVIIPKNYTARYIDGEIEPAYQERQINRAMAEVESASD